MNILTGAGGDRNKRLSYPGREPMAKESKRFHASGEQVSLTVATYGTTDNVQAALPLKVFLFPSHC